MDTRGTRLIQKLPQNSIASKLSNLKGSLPILIIVVALIAGVLTGHSLATKGGGAAILANPGNLTQAAPKAAAQDNTTFKDFAEGTLQKKPAPTSEDDYSEGTDILVRPNAQPVTLTSSVLDLSQYEGKKVKVYGETQKALEAGWLMDVGKVEVE